MIAVFLLVDRAALGQTLLLTPEEVAVEVRSSKSEVYSQLRAGTLTAIRYGAAGRLRVRRADLDAWVKRQPKVEEPATRHGRRGTG